MPAASSIVGRPARAAAAKNRARASAKRMNEKGRDRPCLSSFRRKLLLVAFLAIAFLVALRALVLFAFALLHFFLGFALALVLGDRVDARGSEHRSNDHR